MRKRFLYLSIPAVLLALACQVISGLGNTLQGSGNIATETRPAAGFDRVSVCCGMHLLLSQGNSESLEITADDNLLPEIESAVTNGELVVRYKNRFGGIRYEPTSPVQVRVIAMQLSGINLPGGGWMQAEPLAAEEISLDLSGGGHARLAGLDTEQLQIAILGGGALVIEQLQTTVARASLGTGSHLEINALVGQKLNLESSGGGQIRIQGRVTDQTADLRGGVQYEAGELQSQTANIGMSEGGTGTVWVNETLTVVLSDGAVLNYYGGPQVDQTLSGGSQVNSLGDK